MCLETEFTVCILQAVTHRHFLQQSLGTFWPAQSVSHRGRGPGAFGTRCPSAALGGWHVPKLPAARSRAAGKNAVLPDLPSASTLDYFSILLDHCDGVYPLYPLVA